MCNGEVRWVKACARHSWVQFITQMTQAGLTLGGPNDSHNLKDSYVYTWSTFQFLSWLLCLSWKPRLVCYKKPMTRLTSYVWRDWLRIDSLESQIWILDSPDLVCLAGLVKNRLTWVPNLDSWPTLPLIYRLCTSVVYHKIIWTSFCAYHGIFYERRFFFFFFLCMPWLLSGQNKFTGMFCSARNVAVVGQPNPKFVRPGQRYRCIDPADGAKLGGHNNGSIDGDNINPWLNPFVHTPLSFHILNRQFLSSENILLRRNHNLIVPNTCTNISPLSHH